MLKLTDVQYFVAEIFVYVAVAWWEFTRGTPHWMQWSVGLGAPAIFAVCRGLFASPKAVFELRGVADLPFRLGWFGLGAAAAAVIIAEKVLSASSR